MTEGRLQMAIFGAPMLMHLYVRSAFVLKAPAFGCRRPSVHHILSHSSGSQNG